MRLQRRSQGDAYSPVAVPGLAGRAEGAAAGAGVPSLEICLSGFSDKGKGKGGEEPPQA